MLYLSAVLPNGVAIVDGTNGVYLTLVTSRVDVHVESQVAIITTTQAFRNDLGSDKIVKYAFPLPEGASATQLRWFSGGQWYTAAIGAVPPDTTLPGPGNPHPNLVSYLGETPLFYEFEQQVPADSSLVVELAYAELLPYSFGNVDFRYPNNYLLIQPQVLDRQELNFNLTSPRTITAIQLLSSHPVTGMVNNGNSANLQSEVLEAPADEDYYVQYSLDLNELGLFSFSTDIPDTLLPDNLGGFFLFVAEPDPGNSNVIDKVFTLIVDRSGSMGGSKIVQARGAASFIVNNLNDGDMFNIVDFSTSIYSFQSSHVPYTPANRDAALNYISNFSASGGTNISGAFDVAVPQFSSANDSTANIIIFFTDGQATSGITNTQQLVEHVDNLVAATETEILIFTFGIGQDANQQLLTLLALHNNGLAAFLGNDELLPKITEFYLKIRNPVLLNTQMAFDSPLVHETYPEPLPSLYIGQQLIVGGRYLEPVSTTVTLSGSAFGNPVSYQYQLDLADSTAQQYQFLPKIWAKLKIEHLLVQYYSLDPNSPEAQALKGLIIELSTGYGVLSPFTSFITPLGIEDEDSDGIGDEAVSAHSFELLGNYPNPFNPSTQIRFRVHAAFNSIVKIKIYNSLGQLVRVLVLQVSGPGDYQVTWDGRDQNGALAASGFYVYVLDFGDALLAGKMQLLK